MLNRLNDSLASPRLRWLAALGLLGMLAGAFFSLLTLSTVAQAADEQPALTLIDESGKSISISAEKFAELPRKKVTVKDRDGSEHQYEGPVLADVLGSQGIILGKELRGERLVLCLVVEAADNYRVAFTLSEIDPGNTDTLYVLADRRDGQPLDANEGPLRVIVPTDKRHARWIRQVRRLSITSAVSGSAANAKK